MRARAASTARARHEHAQQRRHSRRDLLPGRHTEVVVVSSTAGAFCTSSAPPTACRTRARARSSSQASSRRSRRSRRCSRADRPTASRGSHSSIRRSSRLVSHHVHAVAALYSPESGIVDAEELVKALLRRGEAAGVMFLPGTRLLGAERASDGMAIRTERETILARQVVNAAGLYADDVSRMLGGEVFTIYPCRGEYAELTPAKRQLVRLARLSACRMRLATASACTWSARQDGAVWLGPTTRYQEHKDDYERDRLPVEAFVEPARQLLPRGDARGFAAGGQRHSRQAASARGIICRFPDSP